MGLKRRRLKIWVFSSSSSRSPAASCFVSDSQAGFRSVWVGKQSSGQVAFRRLEGSCPHCLQNVRPPRILGINCQVCDYLINHIHRRASSSSTKRWKGKGAEAKALANPMSMVVLQLQSSLIQSDAQGILSGSSVLLAAEEEQALLLGRAYFGHPIVNSDKDQHWFLMGMEEAFFLCYSLKCLKIAGEDKHPKDDHELWQYMKSQRAAFPVFYKAYSHLRTKNWVVRPGHQYGVDFVAYCHHPSLVHSEYAVLVSSEGDAEANGRLKVWSDVHCTLRLCLGVVKTLLVLTISTNGDDAASPSCLANYTVDERTVTRWSPEQSREEDTTDDVESQAIE